MSHQTPDDRGSRPTARARRGPGLRRFALQLTANALAISLALALLPPIRLAGGTPRTYLGAGLLFSLINNLVKPLLIVLVGQLLIRSTGLFLLVVNAALFALLIHLSPFDWTIAAPRWLWVLLASALLALAVAAVDALLGLDRLQVDAAGRLDRFWQRVERRPGLHGKALVENVRLQQVRDLVWRYGLDIALGPTLVGTLRAAVGRYLSPQPDPLAGLSTPAKVRLLLQELGPTYVKFGQMLSSQVAALPAEWSAELAQLQDSVPPFAAARAQAIIGEELGAPPGQLFADLEPTPLAAASLAQVHRATLPGGEPVVVKVQRPQIVAMVTADLGVMTKLARTLESRYAWARRLNLGGVVAEFAAGVLKELDFQNEAYHARRLAAGMAALPGVQIPHIYDAYSSARVLTMAYVQGLKLTDTAALDAAGVDRAALAHTFVRALVKQILIDGFFHGDPHPGNVWVDPQTGRLIFLDLGLVGELRPAQRVDLIDLLVCLNQGDAPGLADVTLRLCEAQPALDERAFRADIERAFYQYWVFYAAEASFAGMMNQVLRALSAHGLRLSRELTLAIKAIIQGEVIALALNPQMNWVQVAFDETLGLLGEQLSGARAAQTLKLQALRTLRALRRQGLRP